MTFQELGLDEKLLRSLKTEGYERPTAIQEQAIPVLLQGRDLIGCAQTGTGKTAAFSLPILQHLLPVSGSKQRQILALIVAPTRELAIQINDSLNAYGRHTGLRNTVVFGGVSASRQIKALRQGVDILVATPGRFLDLHNQGEINLNNTEYLVLDEADRMLDMGFIHDIRRIINMLPARRQTLLFSATMPPEVRAIADQYLDRPHEITVELPKEKHLKIEERLYHVEKPEKTSLLAHLIRKHGVEKGIIFTRTKYGADKLARQLSRVAIPAGAIHGNKSQNARQRALEDFRRGRIHVLVASDIAARGLDIDDITHVFNFEIPEVAETYVHRIGRTGRAGATGIAISFCDNNERKYLRNIQKLTRRNIPIQTADDDIASIAELAATIKPANHKAKHSAARPAGGEQRHTKEADNRKGRRNGKNRRWKEHRKHHDHASSQTTENESQQTGEEKPRSRNPHKDHGKKRRGNGRHANNHHKGHSKNRRDNSQKQSDGGSNRNDRPERQSTDGAATSSKGKKIQNWFDELIKDW